MKKAIIIGGLLLVGLAFILPMFKAEKLDVPAKFAFEGNLQFQENKDLELAIDVLDKNISKLTVLLNGKEIKSWSEFQDEMSFKLQGNEGGIGAKQLELRSEYEDGTRHTDSRMVRVVSDITPEELTVQVVNTYPHNPTHFTQGLEFYEGVLYEGTGQYGESQVAEIDLATGKENPNRLVKLDGTHFGEGITILDGKLYQLTWQNGKCLTYDLGEMIVPSTDFGYQGEGWGICNNGEQLIMSNGSERIVFRNPETFLIERTIEVYNNFGPIVALNELEWIDGKIYANAWMSDNIYVIDPATGKVLQTIDASALRAEGQGPDKEVLNGIAYNKDTQKLYLTGKNWVKLFEVKLVEPEV